MPNWTNPEETEANLLDKADRALHFLGAQHCTQPHDDCRPGACDCDGMHDALAYALERYRETHTDAPAPKKYLIR